MEKETKYAISSNKVLVGYLLYAIIICLNDYLVYIFKWDYLMSFIVSAIVVALASIQYFHRNRIAWQKFSVNVYDVIFIFLIIGQCTLRAVMPDTNYDTRNYHLYFQKFFDRDFIHYDFFPMRSFNAQTFGAVADRLFGGSRYFFGYRMGTVLNTFVLVLSYFQIKQLFITIWSEFGHDCSSKWSKVFESVGAFICLMTENVYTLQSTYMVDYLAVPFLLEIIRVVLCEEGGQNKEHTDTAHTAGYLCTMSGFAVAFKMTNSLLIFPLAIIFLLKRRKNLNIRCIFGAFLMLVYPLALYLVISYRITGNPLFPYLNNVFQSPYFSATRSPNDFSGFNGRFGPAKAIEYLLWPLYMLKFPNRVADFGMCSGRMFAIAFVLVTALFFELKHYKFMIKKIFIYCIYCYVLFLSVFHGYMRYIIILEILGSVLAIIILAEWVCNRGYMLKIIGVIGVHFLITQIYSATSSYIIENCELSWRDIKDKKRIVANLPYVFRDYDTGIGNEILDDIQCWIVPDACGSLAAELKGDVPIIGINPYFAVTNDYAEQYLEQRLDEISELSKYSLTKAGGWLDTLETFNSYGLALDEIITIQPNFWDKIWCMPLMKLRTVDGEAGLRCESFTSAEETWVIDITEDRDYDYIDVFIGDAVEENKVSDTEYQISVVGRNIETGEEQLLLQDVVITQTGRFQKLSVNLSDCCIDQIEIRKMISDDADKNASETIQVILQEYLK